MKKLFLTIVSCALLLSANATIYLFNGTGNWNSIANWSPGYPPYATGDTIRIQGNCTIPSGFQVNIPSANITFQIAGSLTVNDSLTFHNFLFVLPNAQLINDDTIFVKYIGLSNGILNQGVIINNGKIEIEDETDGTFENTGSVVNNGALISAGILLNQSNFENHGTAGVSSLGLFTNNGSITGNGTLWHVQNYGSITPGNSTSVANMELYTSGISSNSVFNMNLASVSSFDQIQLNGIFSFIPNGTLNISLNTGFIPSLGERYKLFSSTTPGQLNAGIFSTVNFPPAPTGTVWLINYYADSIVIYLDFTLSEPPLIQFHASKKYTTAELTWMASSDKFHSFVIERASSSFLFEPIGEVEVNQNSGLNQAYHFTDIQPLDGDNYYRLKMYSNQNDFGYSNMAFVNFNHYQAQVVNTIVDDQLQIYSLSNQTISIFDLSGRRILNTMISVGVSNISLPSLTPGQYFVRCEDTIFSILKR